MRTSLLRLCALLLLIYSNSQAQTFVGTTGNIPNNGTTISFPLAAGLMPTSIDSSFGLINVCINISHNNVSDLDIWLITPDSTYIELSTHNGGSGNNYSNTCFYDSVSTLIVGASAPFNGSFRPEGFLYTANNSQNPNGIWQLFIDDTSQPFYSGTLVSWTITFGSNPYMGFPFSSSNLPIIKINTNGQSIVDDPKILANMQIIDNGPGNRNYLNDTSIAFNGNIGIEFRGSSSQSFPKKSFGVETWDSLGNDMDTSLFGMPSESDWVLNASYTDKTFMRNVLSYDLFKQMGNYASRVQYCEVFINGQYMGIYIFLEKVKRDKGRVDIAKLTPADTTGDDLTGGYILKVDKTTGSAGGGWYSLYNPPNGGPKPLIQHEYPDVTEILPVQVQYIKSFCDSFENALYGPNFADPAIGYRKFVDVASWVDFFIISEFSKNVDGYRISTFFYKDKNSNGGLFKMGPVWDYDIAWGNADYYGGDVTSGYAYQYPINTGSGQVPFWWYKLITDNYFKNTLRCRWDDLRNTILSTANLNNWIDSVGVLLDESQQRNFNQWPILGVYVWPNPSPVPVDYAGVKQELKNWINDRSTWLDTFLPGTCSLVGLGDVSGARTNLVAYPNPAKENCWLLIPDQLRGLAQISFYNEMGQLIARSQINAQGKELYIELNNLKSGMHFIELRQGEHVFRAKMMVL